MPIRKELALKFIASLQDFSSSHQLEHISSLLRQAQQHSNRVMEDLRSPLHSAVSGEQPRMKLHGDRIERTLELYRANKKEELAFQEQLLLDQVPHDIVVYLCATYNSGTYAPNLVKVFLICDSFQQEALMRAQEVLKRSASPPPLLT